MLFMFRATMIVKWSECEDIYIYLTIYKKDMKNLKRIFTPNEIDEQYLFEHYNETYSVLIEPDRLVRQ